MTLRAERENAFLGPALFFVSAGATKRRIEAMEIERLLERFGFHHLGVNGRARRDRPDPACETVLVDMNQQIDSETTGGVVAKRDHLAKLPAGVDVQKWK